MLPQGFLAIVHRHTRLRPVGETAEPSGRYSAMTRRSIPVWFVVPAQPVRCDRPPAGRGWVHEIKHDGYRVLVRRDGAVVRIYSRNAINWTDRFSTIATVAATLEAHSFTIDGEAVVIGPDGIAQFDELRRRNGAERATLYGFAASS